MGSPVLCNGDRTQKGSKVWLPYASSFQPGGCNPPGTTFLKSSPLWEVVTGTRRFQVLLANDKRVVRKGLLWGFLSHCWQWLLAAPGHHRWHHRQVLWRFHPCLKGTRVGDHCPIPCCWNSRFNIMPTFHPWSLTFKGRHIRTVIFWSEKCWRP